MCTNIPRETLRAATSFALIGRYQTLVKNNGTHNIWTFNYFFKTFQLIKSWLFYLYHSIGTCKFPGISFSCWNSENYFLLRNYDWQVGRSFNRCYLKYVMESKIKWTIRSYMYISITHHRIDVTKIIPYIDYPEAKTKF